ncbi:MBL fold metallo-hydrolase [Ovoidimarina sediminis]|uniref:MBL fold metallo-hydrolase n=1 Tax=Ovoidimarina sediminis TaxID=3079856 RepID=UPI0029060A08|nr:MBL fold metallo-hydrolase [Rhodophyticola sp. MJ-SS7]MDU8942769.1 MBL fold metallo-hydrolase [Rhodophyticola sp. MJ-SS7]
MARLIAALALFTCLPLAALAQDRRPSHCIAIADAAPGIEYLHLASTRPALPEYTVRISYLAHAMFLIETEGGLSAVTDYTGFIGNTDHVPDVATMNNAHGTHWTASPDPRIPHVLEGWATGGERRDHHVDLGEMLVRNVHTDVRGGDFGGTSRPDGNSIFIFEVAGLCIGHLGHLHHYPGPEQLPAIGRLDVVMAPVDGGYTLDLPTMIRLLKRLRSSVVIPMHWFSDASLGFFAAGMAEDFAIDDSFPSSIEISLATLPDRPTVMLMAPAYLRE